MRTLGVDIRPDVVARNQQLAERLSMPGLQFVQGAIDQTAADGHTLPDQPDVVLALHACDTATDDALAVVARTNARAALAAPCCHHDLQRQLTAAAKAGATPPSHYGSLVGEAILRQRFADVLTDAMRADLMRLVGYRVDVVEFIDSRHTPRNTMLRLRRGSSTQQVQAREVVDLSQDWQVRPYLLDALGDLIDPEIARRFGPRPGVSS